MYRKCTWPFSEIFVKNVDSKGANYQKKWYTRLSYTWTKIHPGRSEEILYCQSAEKKLISNFGLLALLQTFQLTLIIKLRNSHMKYFIAYCWCVFLLSFERYSFIKFLCFSSSSIAINGATKIRNDPFTFIYVHIFYVTLFHTHIPTAEHSCSKRLPSHISQRKAGT